MATKPQFTWLSAAATAVGNVRTHNEDSILDLPSVGLWAVADGMGGHQAGDTASRMVVEALAAVSRHERLSILVDEVEDKLHEVNAALHRAAGGSGLSGTTVTVLLALRRHVLSLWAGDSRLYRSRGGQLEQLTRDHSDTQEMLDDGLISRDELASREPSNVITRAVGGTDELFLDIEVSELEDSDRYLLCTDGLYKELSPTDIGRHLAVRNPAKACQGLMSQALGGVCNDNISAVVVKFGAA
jgi:serine/threonine protein phosphatase PrpC